LETLKKLEGNESVKAEMEEFARFFVERVR